ncbi:MAG TPA: sialidase family protein [Bacteroidota bacterium]|jgi:hypothetical protein
MKYLACLLPFILLATTTRSQDPYWNKLPGPFTGKVSCSVTTPGGAILLGGEMNSPVEYQYYRSTDQGETWEGKYVISKDRPDQTPAQFLLRPNGELYLLTGSALYTSGDEGNTWTLMSNLAGAKSVWFPSNGKIYVAGYYGVFESSDNGASWQNVGPKYQ